MDRQAFVEGRRKYIGASDVGPILGVSRFAGPHDVFLQKLGLQEVESTEQMQTGLDIEKWIIEERYIPRIKKDEDINVIVTRPLHTAHIHPDHDWLMCHPDGLVYVEGAGEEAVRGLEVKNSSEYARKHWGEQYTEQIPPEYELQCQLCMEVIDLDRWDVAVFLGGREFRVYRVYRDKPRMEKLIPVLKAFWDGVKNNEPPPITTDESGLQFLNAWYKEGEKLEVSPSAEIDATVRSYLDNKDGKKAAERSLLEGEVKICDHMKEATDMVGNGWVVTWRFPKARTKTDWEGVARELNGRSEHENFNEIVADHTATSDPKKRTFRVRLLKGEGDE